MCPGYQNCFVNCVSIVIFFKILIVHLSDSESNFGLEKKLKHNCQCDSQVELISEWQKKKKQGFLLAFVKWATHSTPVSEEM